MSFFYLLIIIEFTQNPSVDRVTHFQQTLPLLKTLSVVSSKNTFHSDIHSMVVLPSRVLAIACIFLLSACMVGPNYKEPPQKITQHWKKTSKSVKESIIQNANWWQAFHDPVLNTLIQRGYTDNLSLKATAVHVLQARAQLAQSVGELFPQQQVLNGNLTYNRIGGQSLQFVLPSEFYTNTLGASASWELDFWGKYRRAILANDANFLASYAAYDNALVTLSADIATTYIGIRTTQKLISVTEKNIKVQNLILNIAQTRFHEGQTSLLDVEQSQTILSQTEASLPPLRTQLQQQKDHLGVLLGTTPDKVDALLQKPRGIPYAPAGLAVGIPRETLAKRPDIYEGHFSIRDDRCAESGTFSIIFAARHFCICIEYN